MMAVGVHIRRALALVGMAGLVVGIAAGMVAVEVIGWALDRVWG